MDSISWHLRMLRHMAVATLLTALTGAWGVRGAAPGVGPAGCTGGQACAATLEGQDFADTAVLSERTLRLNGLGLRGVAWIKAFVAGLYLPAPTRDSVQVLTMPGPKRLRLKIMLDAPSHELTKSLTSRIARNETEAAQAQMEERLSHLAGHLDSMGELHVGDTVDIDFMPERGIVLRLNERPVGTPVAGEDLYRSVLKIFVGDRPVDKRLKEGLLRGGV
ncbi:MAG: chalcone isomerase family protein [Proteobacteria bacterium]|uniref:chalcone isomerase family protein n=1 Tax=Aquabacterium sp. TaxID=1872578 RepID=UPI0035C6C04D|nr:chalcone isomerase family protein [Pseudomonadota bacterium]